jgi:hypothetical protein
VKSRLVYYPNENHWVLKPQNSIFWYQENRKWLAEWIGEGPEGVPLAGAPAKKADASGDRAKTDRANTGEAAQAGRPR